MLNKNIRSKCAHGKLSDWEACNCFATSKNLDLCPSTAEKCTARAFHHRTLGRDGCAVCPGPSSMLQNPALGRGKRRSRSDDFLQRLIFRLGVQAIHCITSPHSSRLGKLHLAKLRFTEFLKAFQCAMPLLRHVGRSGS